MLIVECCNYKYSTENDTMKYIMNDRRNMVNDTKIMVHLREKCLERNELYLMKTIFKSILKQKLHFHTPKHLLL